MNKLFFGTPLEWPGIPKYKDTQKSKQPSYGGMFGNIWIKEVIYNKPATIVFWSDNTKTVTKCREADFYSKECGLAICVLKKLTSGTQVKRLFNDWVVEGESIRTLKDVRKASKERDE